MWIPPPERHPVRLVEYDLGDHNWVVDKLNAERSRADNDVKVINAVHASSLPTARILLSPYANSRRIDVSQFDM